MVHPNQVSGPESLEKSALRWDIIVSTRTLTFTEPVRGMCSFFSTFCCTVRSSQTPRPELLMAIPSWVKEMVVCLQVGSGTQLSGAHADARRREERGTTSRAQHLGAHHRGNHTDTSKQLNSCILVQLITFTLALTAKQYMFIVKNWEIRKGHKDGKKLHNRTIQR